MNITIVSGTNRPNSTTRKVVAHLEGIYRKLGHPPKILDLVDLPIECLSPSAYAEKPAAFVGGFADPVLASDGLVVVVPEYNGSMPGSLKVFIDLLKFPESFDRRPVCFIGLAAGMWGALRAVEHLQGIFGYRNAFVYPDRVFLPSIFASIAESGELVGETAERLTQQAEGFVDFVARLKK